MNEVELKAIYDYFGSIEKETLFLTIEDVKRLLTPQLAFSCVEKAFYYAGSKKGVQMPQKIYFSYHDGDMRVMPTVVDLGGEVITGAKLVSIHFNNREIGLPVVVGFFVLVDSATGSLAFVCDATFLTAMRTGAASAVAFKYLFQDTRKKVKLGLIGCGAQARTQIIMMLYIADISDILIYDISDEAVKSLGDFLSKLRVKFSVAKDLRDFSICDVVITLTPSTSPFLKPEHVVNAKLINAMGADAPGKQELYPEIIRESVVIVDDTEQAKHGGEINVPLSEGLIDDSIIFAELGEIVAGKKRVPSGGRIIFDSTGIAILDLFVGWGLYKKALEEKIGMKIKIH